MFEGLPDPDPLIRYMDPDPALDPNLSTILLSSSKKSKKNLDSYCFVTSFALFILYLENDINVPTKSNNQKNFFKLVFCWGSCRSMKKIAGSGSASGSGSAYGSGSISQRHGSEDPDPHRNVMDPEHWILHTT
jgi:hypothetical protein